MYFVNKIVGRSPGGTVLLPRVPLPKSTFHYRFSPRNRFRFGSSRKMLRRLILRTMMWCTAANASIWALRGMDSKARSVWCLKNPTTEYCWFCFR